MSFRSRRNALTVLETTSIAYLIGGRPGAMPTRAETSRLPCTVRPKQSEDPYCVDERSPRSDIRPDTANERLSFGTPFALTIHVSGGHLSRPLNRTLWIGWLLTLILVLGGCVSVTDFRGVQREAEALGVELQMEQRRARELDDSVHQPKEKIRELERTAQAVLEEAARREQEYISIYEELLHFKVPLEQQVGSDEAVLLLVPKLVLRYPTAHWVRLLRGDMPVASPLHVSPSQPATSGPDSASRCDSCGGPLA